MRLNIFEQRILWQLYRLYLFSGVEENKVSEDYFTKEINTYELADFLYDFLIKDGHKIDIPTDIKKQLYRLAIICFNKSMKQTAGDSTLSFEVKNNQLNKFYKSLLARKYLVDKFLETGEKLIITDEDGNKIHRLDLK